MASKAMASHNGPPGKTPEVPPSPSLYVKNLPEKISKQDLRMSLYMLFSTYGPVLDVIAMKNGKMRGQAHIVFRDTQASTQAMRALQGFDFYGKDMKLQYAKGRSSVFTRLEGVYKAPNAPELSSTELQQSIFNAPAVTGVTALPPPIGVPAPAPVSNGVKPEEDGGQGVKRRREDESDEEDAPMDEDDDDVSMEASSDED